MALATVPSEPHVRDWARVLQTDVHHVTAYRKNYRLETGQGTWIAKKIEHVERMRWWLEVDRYMRTQGFRSMPIPLMGGQWLLTPFVPGTIASYANREHITATMVELGRFHRMGRCIAVPPFASKPFLLYRRVYHRLSQFYRLLRRSTTMDGELGELLQTYGRPFYLDGFKAWQRLLRLPLRSWVDEAHASRQIAHRDLASHNWMIDAIGQPWLIDFETAEYDCQLGDVWQMVARMLAENQWERGMLGLALGAYLQERPLAPWEEKVLVLLLSFPNEFFREAIGLASRRRGYHMRYALPYLQRLASTRKKWKEQTRVWLAGEDLF